MFTLLLALNLLLASPNTNRITTSPSAINRVATVSPSSSQARDQNRATVAAKLSLIRRERVRTYWSRMLTRITAAIDRLQKLIERIEDRLAIIDSGDSDIDTTLAKGDLAEAKKLLNEAGVMLETAKGDIEIVLESEDPKFALGKVIDTVQDIKANLVEIHKLLVHAIGSIKGLRVGGDSPTPTPTPS
ncbi:hypothetical protein A2V61_01525 [Candidatus Woesebacteria bacterium RBG_19FT_COMBO_47_8]|uniref:DUF5667 domain-containing protein n=1 Tax=Candidatus Woesebacteria bacterium RBG_13_46_13 TaxID=1802479 RepID=A0A1F7X3G8_9BACT|nr:MAG: hypothetical protein A2Y68_03345 [Candidatus Woesebacteria bacterium RBG_13_46_13]OGM17406.1 MAG: hypothetical protein A2V61_01525 [Candidatus Woesebacteria bacterium RBG_19FT_COMBO_47_8]HJX59593.1 hypothetical protein [Patescibacteria group bacterium]